MNRNSLPPIPNVLAVVRPTGMFDFGLPVEITLPPGLKVRPGEVVDLSGFLGLMAIP